MADVAAVLKLVDVWREYHDGNEQVRVLSGASLEVGRGESVAITGASGSGKSTLLHLAAGMDRPDRGRVEVLGQRIDALPEPARTRFRARHVGLVFQDYNLIESLTARENIELVAWLTGQRAAGPRIDALAAELGLEHLLNRRPDQLSGGQQQRVAIARALVHEPALVLADEPTGSLDPEHAGQVMQVLADAVARRATALVLVTHSRRAAAGCDRILALRHAQLEPA